MVTSTTLSTEDVRELEIFLGKYNAERKRTDVEGLIRYLGRNPTVFGYEHLTLGKQVLEEVLPGTCFEESERVIALLYKVEEELKINFWQWRFFVLMKKLILISNVLSLLEMSFFYGVRIGWRKFFIYLLKNNAEFRSNVEEKVLSIDPDFSNYTIEDCIRDLKGKYDEDSNMSIEDSFISLCMEELEDVEILRDSPPKKGEEFNKKLFSLNLMPGLVVQYDYRSDTFDPDDHNVEGCLRIGYKFTAFDDELRPQELPNNLSEVKSMIAQLFPKLKPAFYA